MSQYDIQQIGKSISLEEEKNVLFAMGPLKAPGLDGLNPLFFQNQWSTLGTSILSKVELMFSHEEVVRKVNDTNIILIPKIYNPETIRDFRPISLCNVIYKLLTK